MGKNIDRNTNLFICFTPLQMLIARALIVAESEFDDANEVLVVPLSESRKYRYYFDLVAQDCTRSWYLPIRGPFPLYVVRLLRLFSNRKYNCVYLASIDSYYAHYVLSYCSFNKLRTFDDGTANITDSSKFYASESGLRVLKGWVHRFIGKKFSQERIRYLTEKHFTLYPKYPNISPNLCEVNLFGYPDHCESSKIAEPRFVLLGTVYREIVGDEEYLDCLLGRIQCLINTFGSHVVTYLPHPRDEQPYFDNVVLGDAERIAEDVVLSLLQKFSHVELIGFCSSTQFNFMNEPRVHNTVIRTSLVSDSWRDLSLMLVGNGAATIDIDAYAHHSSGITV